MRIGWATPLHHRSMAGRFSIGVTGALANRGMRIDLLRTERRPMAQQPRLPTALKVRELARISDFTPLGDYDLLVYNIGNDASLHGHAVDALLRRPGLCIFHDLDLRNLFRDWASGPGRAQTIAGPLTPGATGHNPAMLEWLAPHALAAIAHQVDDLSRLTFCCPGPIRHLPFPSDKPAPTAAPEAAFSFDAYAEALLPLMRAALAAEPLMDLSVQLARELSALEASPDGPEALRMAQMAIDLFCGRNALSNNLAEDRQAADFKFLPAIRGAMTNEYSAIPFRFKKKKRSRLRRVIREIARPFKQVSQALRNRSWTGLVRRDLQSPEGAGGFRK